jgi:hypothetical protein
MKNEILKNLWCLMELKLMIDMVNSKTSSVVIFSELIIANQTLEEIIETIDKTILGLDVKLVALKQLHNFYKSNEELN